MSHVADQILAAVESRLAPVGTVHFLPYHAVPVEDLPAIFVEDVEDETAEELGPGPKTERHRISFTVFGCVAAVSGFRGAAGTLRSQIEAALLGAINDVRLGGLARPGLSRPSADFRVDAETLQKPVGGWALKFNCAYQLKTDAPDTPI